MIPVNGAVPIGSLFIFEDEETPFRGDSQMKNGVFIKMSGDCRVVDGAAPIGSLFFIFEDEEVPTWEGLKMKKGVFIKMGGDCRAADPIPSTKTG